MNLQQQQYLSALNEQQKEAVLCRADIVYVSAGPGSGKTHMLTGKLIDFIQSSDSLQKIVALSYTNTAAAQIGQRFRQQIEKYGVTKEYEFFNGTIHSFCFNMMREYYRSFDYVILDDEELQELGTDIHQSIGKDVSISVINDCLKSNLSNVPEELYEQIANIKEGYKIISIQDILLLFIKALDENEGFRDWMKGRVTAMAFDEAQDLSELNYSIIDRMISIIPHLKVFLVGDPRQNIFEFNGGSYKHLDRFLREHPSHETKHLTITYRCGQNIADYVNTFSFSDCENRQLMSRCEDAGIVTIKRAGSEKEEAKLVLDAIQQCDSLNECAVLSNNMSYLSTLIQELNNNDIPYKVYGGKKRMKKHIRFLNHILRIIDSDNSYSVRKVAQYAGIDIIRDGRRKKSAFYESDLGREILQIREDCRNANFSTVLDAVVSRIMYHPDNEEGVNEDCQALMELSDKFSSVQEYLLSFSTDREQFSQFYLKDYQDCKVEVGKRYLTISTIHSAKGLEWDNVFIVGLSEGNFPNPYFCKGLSPKEQTAYFNAEWKKMYVASTRARKMLYLTYSSIITRKGYSFYKQPSRFISNEIDTGIQRHNQAVPAGYGYQRQAYC